MAGAAEEAGKATSSFINALGGQPVLLVQSLIIAGVVFILYAQGSRSFTEREQLLKSIFDSQQSVREILSKCVVPERRSEKPFDPLVDPPKPHRGELTDPPKAQDPT
jgi:hypothetical protein